VLELRPFLIRTAAPPPLCADAAALQWLALDAREGAALPAPVRRIVDALAAPGLFTLG
jgi:A/G-specific adenine glycosylase